CRLRYDADKARWWGGEVVKDKHHLTTPPPHNLTTRRAMRHLKAGRKLNRNASHRLALMRNLTMALIRHERIITTVENAKALRPFVEKLITQAKKGTLPAGRLVMARLGPPANAEVRPAEKADDDKADSRKVLKKLFDEIGPRFADRPGGYTRIIK